MLYGYFVQNNEQFAAQHRPSPRTPCISYWESPELGKTELNRLLRGADEHDVAFSVASFSGTPVQSIRSAVNDVRTGASGVAPLKLAGANARC
jgi:hypothetical protein